MKNFSKTFAHYRKARKGVNGELKHSTRAPQCVKEHLGSYPYRIVLEGWDTRIFPKNSNSSGFWNNWTWLATSGYVFAEVRMGSHIEQWFETKDFAGKAVVYYTDGEAFVAIGFDTEMGALEFKLTWM